MIKTTYTKSFSKDWDYPVLVENDGLIVLAYKNTTSDEHGYPSFSGTCLNDNGGFSTGHYSETWSIAAFNVYTGAVTLKNE